MSNREHQERRSTKAAQAVGALSADLLVVRVPLLPLDTFTRWADGARAPAACPADDGSLAAALDADRQMLRARLAELVEDEYIAAAIEHASPDLGVGEERWRENPGSRSGRSTERSLVRYMTRMASRPSPFGMASGYLLGELEGSPALSVCGRDRLTIAARIDPSLLEAVVREVAGAARDSDELLLRVNPHVYRCGGRLRVPAPGQRANRPRLVSILGDREIETALEAARGEAAAGAIVGALVERGTSPEEARALLQRLMASQVLIPARQITVTGADPIVQADEALRATPGGERPAAIIRHAAHALAAAPRPTARVIDTVAESLNELPVEVSPRRCVQVDTIREGEVVLPPVVMDEVRRAVEVLALVGARRAKSLAGFKERFERRYGTRSVPLMEALDPDFGVRLEGEEGSKPRADAAADSERRATLLSLIERGRSSPEGEVELTDADIRRLAGERAVQLPSAFALSCTLVGPDLEAVTRGEFVLESPMLAGPPALRLLGRFCHGDPELARRARRHIEREHATDPEAVFAEIVTAPDTDWGLNVTHRPVLRAWEVECGGLSGASPERRLELADLRVCVEDGEITLRSQQLGRRVHPRDSTALVPQWLALPAARFLSLLAAETRYRGLWSWGDLLDAPALPAVRRGRLVLTRRRWTVTAAEFLEIGAGTDASGYRRLQAWRRARGIPRFVFSDHRENRLLVDFDNILSVDAFIAAGQGLPRILLVDAAIGDGSPLRGPDGCYANEFVVAFSHEPKRVAAPAPPQPRTSPPERLRRFGPGSEWLFAKLYGPSSAADRVLLGPIAESVRALRAADLIDRWFFIRYADPDRHLRIRFRGRGRDLLREVLPALHEALAPALECGDVYRICIDTYEREVERYGGIEGVELMELIAEADSDAVLAVLSHRLTKDARRHLAAASVAGLYLDAEFDLDACERCSAHLRTAWRHTLPGGPSAALSELSPYERADRPGVEAIVTSLTDPGAPGVVRALQARSADLRPALSRLRALADGGVLEQPLENVMRSHGHMLVNRLLRDGGSFEELRVHDALARLYASRRARSSAGQRERERAVARA